MSSSPPDDPLPMTDEEFAEEDGLLCPFCRSSATDGDALSADDNGAMRDAWCNNPDCQREWLEVYGLVGYTPKEANEEGEDDADDLG